MMNLVKVISSVKTAGVQFVKFLRMGKSDVQENKVVAPYGIDSNPIEGMIALYTKTGQDGENVLIGYINTKAIAEPGELRLFSTNASGTGQTYQWFKADGTLEINGDEDNMVRFSELKTGFDKLKSDHNKLVQNVNAFFQNYLPGSPTVQGTPLTAVSLVTAQSTASIDNSKIDAILTSRED